MVDHLGNLRRQSTTKVRASIVIRLIDAFTGQAPIEQGLTLTVQGIKKSPIKKPDGYYVLLDLEQGDYILNIQSSNYHEETLNLSFNPSNPHDELLFISLKPSSSYANPGGNACVRFIVKDDSKVNYNDIEITARIMDPKCSVAKMMQDYSANSSRTVNIVQTGQIHIGDLLWIMQKTKTTSECCVVSDQGNNKQSFILQNELMNDYKRGALFLPVIKTTPNKKGEAVIFFRNYPLQTYLVKLEVKFDGYLYEKELNLKESQTENLGILSIMES